MDLEFEFELWWKDQKVVDQSNKAVAFEVWKAAYKFYCV